MTAPGIDPEILQDFLTEAGELVEQLDADLVTLESDAATPGLLDQIFRALHTVKGSAGFLNLTTLGEFAHAAEDALNRLRKGEVSVTTEVIDALLASADILRGQLDDLASGREIAAAPPALIRQLNDVSAGRFEGEAPAPEPALEPTPESAPASAPYAPEPGAAPPPASAQADPADAAPPVPFGGTSSDLGLPPEKLDIMPFMASDLRETIAATPAALDMAVSPGRREEAADRLAEIAASLRSTAEFFAFEELIEVCDVFQRAGSALIGIPEPSIPALLPRLQALHALAEAFAEGLDHQARYTWPTAKLIERIDALLVGDEPDDALILPENATPEEALAFDGVNASAGPGGEQAPGGEPTTTTSIETRSEPAPAATPAAASGAAASDDLAASLRAALEAEGLSGPASADGAGSGGGAPGPPAADPIAELAAETGDALRSALAPEDAAPAAETTEPAPAGLPGPAPDADDAADASGSAGGAAAPTPQQQQQAAPAHAEQTIRVEVARLESLLNLVGELVLTKNQVLGVSRRLRGHELPQELAESLSTVGSELDRLTGEMQVGVMRTRMQPLGKLFGRYPRIIRDLSRKTGKKVNLVIEGGDTEVDKSVYELLGDPLVHMLRNSVDHGIEAPEDRASAGKDETGTLRLAAEHQGGHVRVTITDNGRGIDREVIGRKAVEKGMTTPEALAQMPDAEVFKFIFAPGLSTAAQVSDLSGRGVGMDVVRTNIGNLGGQVNVASRKGEGTEVEILIPLTVAILPAMMVGVGPVSDYAIPIMAIHEIVKLVREDVHTVAGQPVIRLRESVLPLVDMRVSLGEREYDADHGFIVVVGVGSTRCGLIVDRLVGQQEVVIKPLDDEYTAGGPFSGATIREDGDVSLILDVNRLVRSVDMSSEAAAAAAC